MFDDLDATVRAMLSAADAPPDVRAAEVRFDTPAKEFTPAGLTVDLFLHDIRENRELREIAPLRERVGTGFVERRPALRMDCTYLVTAWSTMTGDAKPTQEHRLLAQTLLWLGRTATIETRFLRGTLVAAAARYPVLIDVARPPESQQPGQFWTALGIPPRAGFDLTVTLPMLPAEEDQKHPPVSHVTVEGTLPHGPALSGQVLDMRTLTPLPAVVTVLDNGRQVTTGPAGRFAFPGLDDGEYTLLAQVTDRPETRRQVRYDTHRQIHDVMVPGG